MSLKVPEDDNKINISPKSIFLSELSSSSIKSLIPEGGRSCLFSNPA